MTIADRLREEGTMQGKHEGALRIAQGMVEKEFDHEIILTLTRLSPDNPIAPSH